MCPRKTVPEEQDIAFGTPLVGKGKGVPQRKTPSLPLAVVQWGGTTTRY